MLRSEAGLEKTKDLCTRHWAEQPPRGSKECPSSQIIVQRLPAAGLRGSKANEYHGPYKKKKPSPQTTNPAICEPKQLVSIFYREGLSQKKV